MQQTKKWMLATAVMLFSALGVSAQNIHFKGAPTLTDNGSTQTCCGKLVGLGNNQLVTITLTTMATTTTECTNPGGNVAPGQTTTGVISTSGVFMSDKNGNCNFCLTTNVPAPGTCPNGQWTGTVTDVSFANTYISVNGTRIN